MTQAIWTDKLIMGNQMCSGLHPDDPKQNEEIIPVISDRFDTYEIPANNKSTMEVFNEISLDWKTQIYNNVVKRYGGKPSSYLQGITKDTALPQIAVEEFADIVIKEYNDDPKAAAEILKAAITEHITMMSAVMMNNALKEKGLMGQITKVTDNMIEQVNAKTADVKELEKLIQGGGIEIGTIPVESATTDTTKTQVTIAPSEDQFVNPKHVKFDSKGNVIRKKKGKPKSQHLPNMKTKSVKRALGATILQMLGKVQRDTQDAQKRALLKEIPAADLIEMASGEKIPDYQANLINSWQAKADPDAPVVKRMGEFYKETIVDKAPENPEVTNLINDIVPTDLYELALDEALDIYIQRDFFNDTVTDEQIAAVRESVRESFLNHRKLPTSESIEIENREVLFADPTKGVDYIPVELEWVGESPDGKIRDFRVTYGVYSQIIHYERFTKYAADRLDTTIQYVIDRIDGDPFYEGLKKCVTEILSAKMSKWIKQFNDQEIYELIGKLTAGYTAGYVQAFIEKEHRGRSEAVDAPAADLG